MTSRTSSAWWQANWSAGWPSCPVPPEGVEDFTWWNGCVSRGVDSRAIPAFEALDAVFQVWEYEVTSCGCYNCRSIKGTDTPSSHSSRIAVDINPATNPWGPWVDGELITDMPEEMILTIEMISTAVSDQQVIFWGGRWTTVDPMHFQIVASPAEIAEGVLLPWEAIVAHEHQRGPWGGTDVPDWAEVAWEKFSDSAWRNSHTFGGVKPGTSLPDSVNNEAYRSDLALSIVAAFNAIDELTLRVSDLEDSQSVGNGELVPHTHPVVTTTGEAVG